VDARLGGVGGSGLDLVFGLYHMSDTVLGKTPCDTFRCHDIDYQTVEKQIKHGILHGWKE
jgi:hypothetical protein